MSVSEGMLKYSFFNGTFPLPPPAPSTNISPINMISSFTIGSLMSFDPWVVARPKELESYEPSMPLTMVYILYSKIPSSSNDMGDHIHHHMDCDPPNPFTWFIDSLSSHNFLDTEFPSNNTILNFMDSIDNPKDQMMHQSYFPHSELMRISMMSLDKGLGVFVGAPHRPPSIDLFFLRYCFSKFPPSSLFSLPLKIHVSYLHVFIGIIKEPL
jgi:hypothetical protein